MGVEERSGRCLTTVEEMEKDSGEPFITQHNCMKRIYLLYKSDLWRFEVPSLADFQVCDA